MKVSMEGQTWSEVVRGTGRVLDLNNQDADFFFFFSGVIYSLDLKELPRFMV